MQASRAISRWAVFLFLPSTSACATTAASLSPEHVAAGEGAFFGQVEVETDGENVTSDCYVDFTDSAGERKLYVSLDETGWVFGAVKSGETYLSTVVCTLGGLIKHNATFNPKNLMFLVKDGQTLAYFGHVGIDLHDDGSAAVLGVVAGPIAGALAGSDTGSETYHVQDRFQSAMSEYQHRYGGRAALLKPFTSLAARTDGVAVP